MDAHMASKYLEVVAEIDGFVARIRNLVACYDPLELMRQGYWALSASMIGKETEADSGFSDVVDARMVDYVQSVIVSTPPRRKRKELTHEAYGELREQVKALYYALHTSFHLVHSAHRKANDPRYDADYDFFSVQAQMHYTFVRVLRYPVHDFEFFEDFLGPHDEVFRRLFSIGVSEFIEAIRRIHVSLSRDSVAAFEEMHEEFDRFQEHMERKGIQKPNEDDFAAAMLEFQHQPGWEERRASIAGRIDGLDLFDLQKITDLPLELRDHLSFSPGQDDRFFEEGEYAGWPLRVLPIKFRPFLKVGSRHYCFDQINIMDDIYRVMQRLICRLEPTYVNEWNDRQKEASERRPVELLQAALPGATVHRQITYRWRTGSKGRTNWCELDGLVAFDDTLFVIEVKAGAFTWTPPSTDFPAYLDSIESLLKKPADQALRFLQYLRTQTTVPIYDQNHNQVDTLSASTFRNIVPLCMTLDALTTAAYQIRNLQGVGIQVAEPVCCLSIDDLRVYRDILDAPVVFAHFMETRYAAECEEALHVNDELDHLGLYLAYIDYVRYARELKSGTNIDVRQWGGYRAKIDKYYFWRQVEPAQAKKPEPEVPPRVSEILACLDREGRSGRCRCAKILLEMAAPMKKDFEKSLSVALDRSRKRGQPSTFHVQGESSITVFCQGHGITEVSDQDKRDYTLAWMHRARVPEQLLLTVRYGDDEVPQAVRWEYLRTEDIPQEDRARIAALSDQQARMRVTAQLNDYGRIARNDPCPCGSGRKYKRCCGVSGTDT